MKFSMFVKPSNNSSSYISVLKDDRFLSFIRGEKGLTTDISPLAPDHYFQCRQQLRDALPIKFYKLLTSPRSASYCIMLD